MPESATLDRTMSTVRASGNRNTPIISRPNVNGVTPTAQELDQQYRMPANGSSTSAITSNPNDPNNPNSPDGMSQTYAKVSKLNKNATQIFLKIKLLLEIVQDLKKPEILATGSTSETYRKAVQLHSLLESVERLDTSSADKIVKLAELHKDLFKREIEIMPDKDEIEKLERLNAIIIRGQNNPVVVFTSLIKPTPFEAPTPWNSISELFEKDKELTSVKKILVKSEPELKLKIIELLRRFASFIKQWSISIEQLQPGANTEANMKMIVEFNSQIDALLKEFERVGGKSSKKFVDDIRSSEHFSELIHYNEELKLLIKDLADIKKGLAESDWHDFMQTFLKKDLPLEIEVFKKFGSGAIAARLVEWREKYKESPMLWERAITMLERTLEHNEYVKSKFSIFFGFVQQRVKQEYIGILRILAYLLRTLSSAIAQRIAAIKGFPAGMKRYMRKRLMSLIKTEEKRFNKVRIQAEREFERLNIEVARYRIKLEPLAESFDQRENLGKVRAVNKQRLDLLRLASQSFQRVNDDPLKPDQELLDALLPLVSTIHHQEEILTGRAASIMDIARGTERIKILDALENDGIQLENRLNHAIKELESLFTQGVSKLRRDRIMSEWRNATVILEEANAQRMSRDLN